MKNHILVFWQTSLIRLQRRQPQVMTLIPLMVLTLP
jgi:hypothetical protein